MTAQIDLGRGREPAEAIAVALGHEKRGFRRVVLGRDRLHHGPGQPRVERAHGRRFAGERPIGKGVDLVERNAHRLGSLR